MIAKNYSKSVATIPVHSTAIEAAQRMRRENTGCLVVINDDHVVVGVLTDRDLLLRVVAQPALDGSVPVREIMSSPPISAEQGTPVSEVLDMMSRRGVRRIPIVRDGRAVGLLSLDDLLHVLSMELHELTLGTTCKGPTFLDRVDSRHEDVAFPAE